jgi:hypothetical protein
MILQLNNEILERTNMKTLITFLVFISFVNFNSFAQSPNFFNRKYMKGIFIEKKSKSERNKATKASINKNAIIKSRYNTREIPSEDSLLVHDSQKGKRILEHCFLAVANENKPTVLNTKYCINHNTIFADSSTIYCSSKKDEAAFIKARLIFLKDTIRLNRKFLLQDGVYHKENIYLDKNGKVLSEQEYHEQVALYTKGEPSNISGDTIQVNKKILKQGVEYDYRNTYLDKRGHLMSRLDYQKKVDRLNGKKQTYNNSGKRSVKSGNKFLDVLLDFFKELAIYILLGLTIGLLVYIADMFPILAAIVLIVLLIVLIVYLLNGVSDFLKYFIPS